MSKEAKIWLKDIKKNKESIFFPFIFILSYKNKNNNPQPYQLFIK